MGKLSDAGDFLPQLEQLARETKTSPAPDLAPPTATVRRPETPASATSAEEHRARMRHKLLTRGADALLDHEMLEMVLFLALPRKDTKPVAYRLLARFGSFANAIAAPARDIAAVDGMGEASAAALKIVQAAAVRLAKAELTRLPLLSNWDALIDYLKAVMARERVEQFRVLFLDNRNRLLADEVQGKGTVNHTPVYPREVLKRALELGSTALVLVHNHPSGDPTPSQDDIVMTRNIHQAVQPLGIVLHDHVIVGNGRCTSFRREGLL
jgi:DNA repair protein RadC